MQIRQLLSKGTRELSQAGLSSARLDTLLLLSHVTAQDRTHVLAHPEQQLSERQTEKYLELLRQRAQHRPLAQLLQTCEFYGLQFKISRHVLTPRPESELIVELAAQLAPAGGRVIDVGTGSGALAIALAHSRPDLQISASDVSTAALKVARANAQHHETKVEFIESDLWDQVSGQFDLVLANLPYVAAPNALNRAARHEPAVSLFGGGADGLELYRQFFAALPAHLNRGGLVICESDPWQQAELASLATAAGLSLLSQDYFISCFKAAEELRPASR